MKKTARIVAVLMALCAYLPIQSIVKTKKELNLYAQNPDRSGDLTDGKLHVYICGTGDPQTNMQGIRKPSCVAVGFNGEIWVFDAGEGAIQTIAGMGLPINKITKVFLTHLHSDHMAGLAQIINQSWIERRQKPIEVYGPEGTQQVLAGLKTAYDIDTKVRLEIEGLNPKLATANAVTLTVDDLDKKNIAKPVLSFPQGKLLVFKVKHDPMKPAFGYTLVYNGVKIVISGDTTLAESLADNAKDADILINEAYSTPFHYEQIKRTQNIPALIEVHNLMTYHTDSLELAKMAELGNVKNLVLTHLLPSIPNDIQAKKDFVAGMSDYYAGPIIVADDGDEIVVESNDKVKDPANNTVKSSIVYKPANPGDFYSTTGNS